MRRMQTAVIERKRDVVGTFATEPFEAGWAREARWFVKVSHLDGPPGRLSLATQISPDGLDWVDLEGEEAVEVDAAGMVSWPVREFGQWLRVRGAVDEGTATVMIYLTVKE
jgi:hypothetical protein